MRYRAMLMLVALVACGTVATAQQPVEFRSPKGIYVFRAGSGAINLNVLGGKAQNIAGWVLRDKWFQIQPSEDVEPDFSRLLEAAKIVAQQGKTWQLEIFAGTSIPPWAGNVNSQLDPEFMPKYLKLVEQMGAAFSGDPNLVAVHCTLPMTGSPEFRLAGTNLDAPGWHDRALAANAMALTALAKMFPGCVIVVDLHNPLNASDDYLARQIEQGTRLLGKQFAVQENGWNSKPGQTEYSPYQAVKKLVSDGYVAGLEQVQPSTSDRYYELGSATGAPARSLDYAKGVDYLIIYEPDIRNVSSAWSK